ncbi:MAG: PspA/IM30 family protein [Candidatus Tectimicrobiota bacterium]
MSLLRRLTRLWKADLHGLLDDLEDPEAVVKQAIRDMEEDLAQQEQHLGELACAQQGLAHEAAELDAALQALAPQIDLCFAAANESLARALLRQRLELTQRARSVARAQSATLARHAALAQTIAAQKQQLAAIVQQLALLTATRSQPTWAAPPGAACHGASTVTDTEVEVAFLEEQQRRRAHATSNPA